MFQSSYNCLGGDKRAYKDKLMRDSPVPDTETMDPEKLQFPSVSLKQEGKAGAWCQQWGGEGFIS